MKDRDRRELEGSIVHVRIKLSLLWTSLMFLFIYNDYFSMFAPGTLEMMMAGQMGPLGPATDAVLIAVSALMAIPALMAFLSAALPPAFSRGSNLILGVVYAVVQVLTLFGSPPFYQGVVLVEVALLALIVWYAYRWPSRLKTT